MVSFCVPVRSCIVAISLALSGCGGPVDSDVAATPPDADTHLTDGTGVAETTETDADTNVEWDLDTAVELDADMDVDLGPIPTGPIGGDDRPAPVTLPADYTHATSWPLVILLHGYSVNGWLQNAFLGFTEQTSPLGFIGVVPDGTLDLNGKRHWNAIPECWTLGGTDVDDEAYLLSLVSEAKALWNVDPARVYFIGHSNGGFMSYRMACNHADVVAGVASIAGPSYFDAADCQPSEPVSVLHIHGTADDTVDFLDAECTPGAETIVSRWVSSNACSSAPIDRGDENYDSAVIGPETTVTGYSQCEGNTGVAFWKMNGSGHIAGFTENFTPDLLTWLFALPKAP